MNKFLVLIVLFVCCLGHLQLIGQQPQNLDAQKQQLANIKPTVYATDLVFAFQMLSTIELKATEVDALLEVKTALKPYIEKIQKDNIPLANPVIFEISSPLAYNLLQFLERGRLTGADAEKYKRFKDGITEAAKKAQEELLNKK
ncbi:hypothetical protein MASR1M45_21830 [Candidatus Kapaibacterium sp.]